MDALLARQLNLLSLALGPRTNSRAVMHANGVGEGIGAPRAPEAGAQCGVRVPYMCCLCLWCAHLPARARRNPAP